MSDARTPLLKVEGLRCGYGDLQILQGFDLEVMNGEVVAAVGPNGVGKTTLLNTISGLVKPREGRILFDGQDIGGRRPHHIVEAGLVMVPEGRHLFTVMTVEENLLLGAYPPGSRKLMRKTLDEAYELFPVLRERRNQDAGSLSGGEQQMCAIGRALMSKPRLLMLDEPSLGLAPIVVKSVFKLVGELASRGLTVLLVEQKVREALQLSARGYVVDRGRVVMTGPAAELLADPQLQEAYLGV
jgi:branched-chain amino acid transport system ATP-binding protein